MFWLKQEWKYFQFAIQFVSTKLYFNPLTTVYKNKCSRIIVVIFQSCSKGRVLKGFDIIKLLLKQPGLLKPLYSVFHQNISCTEISNYFVYSEWVNFPIKHIVKLCLVTFHRVAYITLTQVIPIQFPNIFIISGILCFWYILQTLYGIEKGLLFWLFL